MSVNNSLTLEQAQSLIDQACIKASEMSLALAIVVVDRGGHVVSGVRMDGTGYVAFEIAQKKAVASANFGAPTAMLNQMSENDAVIARAFASSNEISTVPGAAPIILSGDCVGGIGISGGHYAQDDEVVMSAVAELA